MTHLVTLDFPPDYVGGIAAWAEDLARALAAAGEEVCVYARYNGHSQAYDEHLPFPVFRLQGRSWGKWQALWVQLQVGPRVKPGDRVIFATWELAEVLGPRLPDTVQVAVFFHGSDLTRFRGRPARLRRVIERARCFPVSGFLLEQLRALGGEGRVLPMPLPLGPPSKPGEGLVVVARLNRLKGVDRVIRLARALDWPLTVVGEGPALTSLEVLAIELSVEVDFKGRLPRVRALDAYAGHAACLLLPRTDEDGSGAEGLGLVLLEAMSRGVPAVGCSTGGVPEAAGLVLDDPDDAEGSAERLRGWLAGGDRGAEGRAWFREHHGPERAASALLEALA